MKTAIVRTRSHRAREKLNRLLGYQPKEFCSFWQEGSWQEVPEDKLEEILKIKGISKSKLPEKSMETIKWV